MCAEWGHVRVRIGAQLWVLAAKAGKSEMRYVPYGGPQNVHGWAEADAEAGPLLPILMAG